MKLEYISEDERWVRNILEDSKIIDLFYERSEQAILELSKKYGALCYSIARNILNNVQDVEECVNDAYLAAWNTIPPQNPNPLKSYINRIVRNIAITKYHTNTAAKRNSTYDVALDELEECIPARQSIEDEMAVKELTQAMESFLDTLDKESRVMFVRRYWYSDSISDIAERFQLSNNNVTVKLSRIRGRLKKYLEKEGFIL